MIDGHSDNINHIFEPIIERLKRKSLYQSPFELFVQRMPGTNFYDHADSLQYSGTLATVFDELTLALQQPDLGENYKVIALHPSRLIRGIVDAKIENGSMVTLEDVQMSIKVGLSVYQKSLDSPTLLKEFRDRLENGNQQILQSKINQKKDLPTWYGTEPARSYKTAQDFAFSHPGENILLISIAHGGVAAGMDVFLRFKEITQTDSVFYVARLSRLKKKDVQPQLNDDELVYLQQQSLQRKVVIFEEDSPTGTTLEIAKEYFQKMLANNKLVTVLSNTPTIFSPSKIS